MGRPPVYPLIHTGGGLTRGLTGHHPYGGREWRSRRHFAVVACAAFLRSAFLFPYQPHEVTFRHIQGLPTLSPSSGILPLVDGASGCVTLTPDLHTSKDRGGVMPTTNRHGLGRRMIHRALNDRPQRQLADHPPGLTRGAGVLTRTAGTREVSASGLGGGVAGYESVVLRRRRPVAVGVGTRDTARVTGHQPLRQHECNLSNPGRETRVLGQIRPHHRRHPCRR
jgi:hypothetical protein